MLHRLCRRDLKAFGVEVSIIEPGFFKTAVTQQDLIEADLRRLWNRLPQDVKDLYGPTFVDKCKLRQSCCRCLKILNLVIYEYRSTNENAHFKGQTVLDFICSNDSFQGIKQLNYKKCSI